MTDAAITAPGQATVTGKRGYLTTFWGMLLRDVRVLRRQLGTFAVRTLMQPLLVVFVFGYVFPRIGQGFETPDGVSFTTILLPGLIGFAILFQGVSAVALPLVTEFNISREIEDRAMAPLPTSLLAVEKVVFGAVQGLLAAVAVFPSAYLVSAGDVEIDVDNWPLLLTALVLGSLAASALGLLIGTAFKPSQVPLIFSVIVLPITFLGCIYYPWASLSAIPWLQVLTLLNPLVYLNEALRAALTPQIEHLAPWVTLAALTAATLVIGWLGIRGFRRRVLS